jgi:hypothetical protein
MAPWLSQTIFNHLSSLILLFNLWNLPWCFAVLGISDVCRNVCLAVGVSCATYSTSFFPNVVRKCCEMFPSIPLVDPPQVLTNTECQSHYTVPLKSWFIIIPHSSAILNLRSNSLCQEVAIPSEIGHLTKMRKSSVVWLSVVMIVTTFFIVFSCFLSIVVL